MAKGMQAKEELMKKMMFYFQGAFIYGKELRIPMEENGKPFEMKISFSVARDIVGESITSEEIRLAPFSEKEISELEEFLDARI